MPKTNSTYALMAPISLVNPKPNIIMAGKAGPRIPSNKKACTRDGSFGLLDELEALVEDCERGDVEVVTPMGPLREPVPNCTWRLAFAEHLFSAALEGEEVH